MGLARQLAGRAFPINKRITERLLCHERAMSKPNHKPGIKITFLNEESDQSEPFQISY